LAWAGARPGTRGPDHRPTRRRVDAGTPKPQQSARLPSHRGWLAGPRPPTQPNGLHAGTGPRSARYREYGPGSPRNRCRPTAAPGRARRPSPAPGHPVRPRGHSR
jgi:hypothetical protein